MTYTTRLILKFLFFYSTELTNVPERNILDWMITTIHKYQIFVATGV